MGGLLHALFGAVTGLTAKRLESAVAYMTKSAA
jgi:hypothetical protein